MPYKIHGFNAGLVLSHRLSRWLFAKKTARIACNAIYGLYCNILSNSRTYSTSGIMNSREE